MNLGQWGWVKVLGRLGTLGLGGKNLQLLTLCTFPAQMAGRSGRVSLSLFDVQILESAYFPIHCPSMDSTLLRLRFPGPAARAYRATASWN